MASQMWNRRQRPEETTPTLGEPDDILIADPRGGLTPSQMVDQKLRALLAGGRSQLFTQATGRRENMRKVSANRKFPGARS